MWNESDALLKANLAKSHSPYYLMSQLGSNARKLGRNDEALRWYEEAFARSEGPATRLQWGAQYVTALVELAPQDEPRLEQAVARMIDEAARDKARFDGRSARSLARVDKTAGAVESRWPASAPCSGRLRAQLAAGVQPSSMASRRARCVRRHRSSRRPRSARLNGPPAACSARLAT